MIGREEGSRWACWGIWEDDLLSREGTSNVFYDLIALPKIPKLGPQRTRYVECILFDRCDISSHSTCQVKVDFEMSEDTVPLHYAF